MANDTRMSWMTKVHPRPLESHEEEFYALNCRGGGRSPERAIAYSRVDTGPIPSAVPSSSNSPASHSRLDHHINICDRGWVTNMGLSKSPPVLLPKLQMARRHGPFPASGSLSPGGCSGHITSSSWPSLNMPRGNLGKRKRTWCCFRSGLNKRSAPSVRS